MKLFLIVFVSCILGLTACTEEKPGLYAGDNYVQFYYANPMTFDYISNPLKSPVINANRLQDTIYFRVQVIGQPSDRARQVSFEQYQEEDEGYEQAVPGVNYVPFDDLSLQELMVVPGDTAYANIPVVILYDKTSAGMNKKLKLHFKIIDSEDLRLGQPFLSKGLVTISQR